MAEVAAILHWPLPELQAMPLDELLDWHGRAIAFWKADPRVRAVELAKALGG